MATTIPNIIKWSIVPQKGTLTFYDDMNVWLGETNTVVDSWNVALDATNDVNQEINNIYNQIQNADPASGYSQAYINRALASPYSEYKALGGENSVTTLNNTNLMIYKNNVLLVETTDYTLNGDEVTVDLVATLSLDDLVQWYSFNKLDHKYTKDIDTIGKLRELGTPFPLVWVSGYHSKNDGAFGSNIFRWNPASIEDDNGGTTIKLDSIANGRYELQYSGSVNVKWFGAKSDGVSDDAVAIQNAIDFSEDVFIPRGHYIVGATLLLGQAVRLSGESMKFATNIQGSTLLFDTGVDVGLRINVVSASPYFLGKVSNMSFRAVDYSTTLIELGNKDNQIAGEGAWVGTISECSFDHANIAILGTHSQSFRIEDNLFRDIPECSISYDSTPSSALIRNNQFDMSNPSSAHISTGIRTRPGAIGGGSGLEISHNYFLSCKHGCILTGISGSVIQGNTFELCSFESLKIDRFDWEGSDTNTDTGSNSITGNYFIGWGATATQRAAIKLLSTYGNTVWGNTYKGPWGAGTSDLKAIDLFDAASYLENNTIELPIALGVNSQYVIPVPKNSLIKKQTIQGANGYKLPNLPYDNSLRDSNSDGTIYKRDDYVNPMIYRENYPYSTEIMGAGAVVATAGAIAKYVRVHINGVEYSIPLHFI